MGRPRIIPHQDGHFCHCIDCRRKRGEFRLHEARKLEKLAKQLSQELIEKAKKKP
jgi:hypothetical protein